MQQLMWLVNYRKSNNMTQSDVSVVACISRAHYTNIEKGTRRPSPEAAQKIAQALDFDWKLFFEPNTARQNIH